MLNFDRYKGSAFIHKSITVPAGFASEIACDSIIRTNVVQLLFADILQHIYHSLYILTDQFLQYYSLP